MNEQALSALLKNAFNIARSLPDPEKVAGPVHADRSMRFVEAMAGGLREHYKTEKFIVFSKFFPGHRTGFKLNELLYDIHVCESACVPDTKLCYVKRSVLQVESEFARDAHEALIDFSKLVAGAAEHKLFIGPLVNKRKQQDYMAALTYPAAACSGTTYLALVEHPGDWAESSREVEHRFRAAPVRRQFKP